MKIRDELLIIDILTILLIIIITFMPLEWLRAVLGLPVALFFPGYTLLVALFPHRDSLGGIERIALSFGMSVLVVGLLGLVLNYTPFLGINLYTVPVSTAIFILAASAAALTRRYRLLPAERFVFTVNLNLTKWAVAAGKDKIIFIGIVVAIMLAMGTFGYALATRDTGESFTQFYLLGPDGSPEGYPEELVLGEPADVIMAVINQEHRDMSYRLEAAIDGDSYWGTGPLSLEHGDIWEETIQIMPVRAGDAQQVEFFLYKNGEEKPCLRLFLLINVRSSG